MGKVAGAWWWGWGWVVVAPATVLYGKRRGAQKVNGWADGGAEIRVCPRGCETDGR